MMPAMVVMIDGGNSDNHKGGDDDGSLCILRAHHTPGTFLGLLYVIS
jgi:hypothetical protein